MTRKKLMLEHIWDLLQSAMYDIDKAEYYSKELGLSLDFKNVYNILYDLSLDMSKKVEDLHE